MSKTTTIFKITALAEIAGKVIKWGGTVLVAYFSKEAVLGLSGKTTITDISIEFLRLGRSNLIVYLILLLLLMYARSQYMARRAIVRRMGARIKKLETLLDPNRSSSELTETGDTRPEDT